MILVTGGTGLVGSHLLYKLSSNNEPVRAIFRHEQKLAAVKKVFSYYTTDVEHFYNRIEWIQADLNDVTSLSDAFKNVTHVYHCAAFVSFEPDKYRQLRKINIEGTANIVNLCVSNQIKKICYVSSIAATGHELDPNKSITEETSWNPEEDHSVYAITKYGAEIEVWRGTQEGVDAVIVKPGIVLGPGFWKGGGSGSLFQQVYKEFPYYSKGITGYVDVDDVTKVMLQLMTSDIKNESYIVVSENMSFEKFQMKVAQVLGVKPPRKEANRLMLEIGWRLDWLNHKLRGKRRKLSKQIAKTANAKKLYNNLKLKKALNFEYISLEDSITKTGNYFLNDLKDV